jgi:hypothetical protein
VTISRHRFRRAWVAPAVLSVVAVGGTAGIAVASTTTKSSHAPWHVRILAKAPVVRIDGKRLRLSSPDDITDLGGNLFVTWQNGVGPQGQPAGNGAGVDDSVITEYSPSGRLLRTWNLHDKCDGLTADPAAGVVIATIDEDANSSLDTIKPSAPSGHQVVHYHYDPGNPLPHGGGTDAISIVGRQILISASAPGTQGVVATTPAQMPAVYKARLVRSGGTDTGTAHLSSLFSDGAKATVANTALPTPSAVSPSPPTYCSPKPAVCTIPPMGTRVGLKLTDPDSNEIVPAGSPRFAGDFVLDSQGDEQQIYVKAAGTARQRLSVLYLSQSIDDTAYITDPADTLYTTDQATNQILSITGPFRRGEAIVSGTPTGANNAVNAPNYMASMSLKTGTVTRIQGLSSIQSEGLLFTSLGS